MARKFGPFDNSVFYEVENRRLQRGFNSDTGFIRPGPLTAEDGSLILDPWAFYGFTSGRVTAGTGAQLVIAPYPFGALIDGMYVENPASETVALATNAASTNPRIDRLVMRLDMNAKTIAPFQIVGTPAASPQIPPLVRNTTVFDMPLCRFTMPGSASAQNPGSIVDERVPLSSAASFATGRAAITSTGAVNPDAALTGVITVPAASTACRVVFAASGRTGNAASARTVAWGWDSTPGSATNGASDDPAVRITAPGGQYASISSTLTMDVPAGVEATARLMYRASGNGFNHGAVVWTRGPAA